MIRAAAFFLTLFAAASPAFAQAQVGYAQATGYYKKAERPSLYQPLNLLDGREATSWCSSTNDVLADQLTFGFKASVTIDEVRIYTGNGFDESTFKEYARARKFALKGPASGHTFELADDRGQQSVALNPPLKGAHFTLEILDQYPAEDPDQPVCITDVVFYSGGHALNGPWLTTKLKYDRGRAAVLGTWFGGSDAAPDRFLSFFFDGTYRYSYEPYDPGEKPKLFAGDYDVTGSRITLDIPKQGKILVHYQRGKAQKQGSLGRTLQLQGNLPADLRAPFRDIP